MISESLAALRLAKGISQEKAAEVAGVSRQAYARWEQGDVTPSVEHCARLARFFGTSVDAMLEYPYPGMGADTLPGPSGKHIWGAVTMGERGQIVIPKAAREMFGLHAGSRLIVLGDEAEGIALVEAGLFEDRINKLMQLTKDSMRELEQ